MKSKLLLCSIMLLFLAFSARGQDRKLKFLFVESGADFLDCEEPEKDYMRSDIDPLWSYYATDGVRSLCYTEHFGIRLEYRMLKNKLGISSGLRYTRMFSSIGKTSYWTDSPEFFYIRYRMDATSTEYAKVYGLSQKATYLEVPLEFRIYPYSDYPVNVYYKAGVSFAYNIASRSAVDFYEAPMESYEAEVAAVIEDPSRYYGTFHLGIGLKIGKLSKPGLVLEANVPVAIAVPDKACFVKPQTGAGFQIMVRVPLTKNEKK